MPRPEKLLRKTDAIRKYFFDHGQRELFIFGKQGVGVRRISDHTIAISEQYVHNYFRSLEETDLVIVKIRRALISHLSGYAAADRAILRKLREHAPVRNDGKRKAGLRSSS